MVLVFFTSEYKLTNLHTNMSTYTKKKGNVDDGLILTILKPDFLEKVMKNLSKTWIPLNECHPNGQIISSK